MIIKVKRGDAFIEAISNLHHKIFTEIDQLPSDLVTHLNETDVECWAMTKDAHVVAYCTIRKRSSSTWYLTWTGVAIDCRKQGLGKQILSSIIALAAKSGVQYLELDSRNRYKEAICLYLASGFDIVGTRLGSDQDVMVALRLRLS